MMVLRPNDGHLEHKCPRCAGNGFWGYLLIDSNRGGRDTVCLACGFMPYDDIPRMTLREARLEKLRWELESYSLAHPRMARDKEVLAQAMRRAGADDRDLITLRLL